MAKSSKEYKYKVNAEATALPNFSTASCFNSAYVEATKAPIDSCAEKLRQLNLIHTQYASITVPADNVSTIYNLILLGYISAIESYIREIIRKIILLDDTSRISCESEEISYGAAINYPRHLLPEVMLEKASFASKKNIVDGFKKFLGIDGHQPDELLKTLEEFERICHLRHCIIHRFGKLGSQNAIKFGLDSHSTLVEKPLNFDINMIYDLSIICTNTVLVINKFLYKKVLERTASKNSCLWQWDLRKDKASFSEYYNLFSSSELPHVGSSLKDAYVDLKKYHQSL